jgi:PAS domain S-box-containing protein
MLASLPVALCGTNRAGTIVFWSTAMRALTAQDTHDVLGQPLCSVVNNADALEVLEQALDSGQVATTETFALSNRESGQSTDVKVTVTPVVAEDGGTLGCWLEVRRHQTGLSSSDTREAAAEILRLAEEMMNGELSARGREADFSGAAAEVICAVNQMLDALITPLRVAAESIRQMAHGSIPDFIITEYKGEFNEIKRNLNTFLAVLYGMHHETQNLIRAIKEGKLDTRGNDWDFEGNWKALIAGVNDVLDATINPVQEASGVLSKLSTYDLTARMSGKYRGDHARIKKVLNTSLHSLCEAFLQVSGAVSKVSAAAQEISRSSDAVAAGASEQASSLREISGSMTQIAQHSKQTAENTKQAREITVTAQQSVEDGRSGMMELLDAVGQIRAAAENTQTILQEINAISSQTDELAKNAAREAARVGASARGFAVVAEEVRKLSKRSKDVAVNIEQIAEVTVGAGDGEAGAELSQDGMEKVVKELHTMALQTNYLALNAAVEAAYVDQAGAGFEAVTAKVQDLAGRSKESAVKTEGLLNDSVALSRNGEELSRSVNSELVSIIDSVGRVTELVNKISGASDRQAAEVDGVNQMIAQINRVTQENSESANRSTQAAAELTSQTETLSESVHRFKLPTGCVAP